MHTILQRSLFVVLAGVALPSLADDWEFYAGADAHRISLDFGKAAPGPARTYRDGALNFGGIAPAPLFANVRWGFELNHLAGSERNSVAVCSPLGCLPGEGRWRLGLTTATVLTYVPLVGDQRTHLVVIAGAGYARYDIQGTVAVPATTMGPAFVVEAGGTKDGAILPVGIMARHLVGDFVLRAGYTRFWDNHGRSAGVWYGGAQYRF